MSNVIAKIRLPKLIRRLSKLKRIKKGMIVECQKPAFPLDETGINCKVTIRDFAPDFSFISKKRKPFKVDLMWLHLKK